MVTDKKLWDDFRHGKKYALPHIYYQNIQYLFRYGKKFSKDDEVIKDTIQDLFFDLIRTRKNLGETDNIKFYLIASFRRKLALNIQKQITPLNIQAKKYMEAEIIYSAEQALVDKEELTHREKLVQRALKELSPRQREILFYRFTCDFDYEKICEIMSLKYDSARKQVFRALKSLRHYLPDSNIFLLFLSPLTKKATPL